MRHNVRLRGPGPAPSRGLAADGHPYRTPANENHAKLCPSPEWAEYLQAEILPWVGAGVDLGRGLIEVGPGPGASTEWLHGRVERLVAVERDERAAAGLTERFAGTNVEVVCADATAMDVDSFDSAGSFTMLHHVPTAALQNRLLAEVLRVLRPGGVLIGSDSAPSDGLHHAHKPSPDGTEPDDE